MKILNKFLLFFFLANSDAHKILYKTRLKFRFWMCITLNIAKPSESCFESCTIFLVLKQYFLDNTRLTYFEMLNVICPETKFEPKSCLKVLSRQSWSCANHYSPCQMYKVSEPMNSLFVSK